MKVGVVGQVRWGGLSPPDSMCPGDVNVLRSYRYCFFIPFMSEEALTVR